MSVAKTIDGFNEEDKNCHENEWQFVYFYFLFFFIFGKI